MRKIKFYLSIGYAGADYDEIMEFPDNMTDEEIDECFHEWVNGYIDAEWYKVEA